MNYKINKNDCIISNDKKTDKKGFSFAISKNLMFCSVALQKRFLMYLHQ